MAIIDERTPKLNLPLPVRTNSLKDDCERLRETISTLDEKVATVDADGRLTVAQLPTNVPTVGGDGKLPVSSLPAVAITDTFQVASQAAMLALNAQTGDVAVRTDLNKTFILMAEPATTLSNWVELLNDVLIQLSANDGERYIGTCPDIATLRSIEPKTAGQRITLREHTAGTGKGGGQFRAVIDGSNYTDDNGAVIKTAAGAAWLRINADVLSPLMFGCVANANGTGDATGVADDTVAMRNAISAAATLKRPLRGAGETYGISSMLPMFAGNTEIAHLNIDIIRSSASGVLEELFSFKGGETEAITINFHHVKVETHAKVRQPIILDSTRYCEVHHCTFRDVDTAECYGIRVGISTSGRQNIGNKIYSNNVFVGADPDNGTGAVTRNGIALFGAYAEPVDGDSGPDWTIQPTIQNTEVYDNYVVGGTHNIHVRGCVYLDIHDNTLRGGSHRNINLSRMSQRVHIHDNMLLDAGSAAVVFGYTRWVKISNNYIYSSVVTAQAGDDAAIQFGEWVEGLEINDNTIRGSWVWGIHGECLRGGVISDNVITASWACIALESQWTATVPELAKYTKTRTVPYKANTHTYDVLIKGNHLFIGNAGCGVYLSCFNGRQMQRVTIQGNHHAGASIGDSVYLYEENASLMGNIQLLQHVAPGATASSYYTNSTSPVRMVTDVSGLSDMEAVISNPGNFTHFGAKMLSMGGAFAVTNILGYSDGATITVRGLAGASLVHDSTRMRLKGAVNASFADGNSVITLMRRGGIWFELSRNF